MKIYIASGAGTGRTLLSAFDSALLDSGVANYNLVRLSSIIPPGSKIIRTRQYKPDPDTFGDRLYAVRAEYRSQRVGKFIAAGIGWYQFDDDRGFFVEHEDIAETKVAVQSEIDSRIENSLRDLCQSRHLRFQPSNVQSKTIVREVTEGPTCVLVVAVFKHEPWEQSYSSSENGQAG